MFYSLKSHQERQQQHITFTMFQLRISENHIRTSPTVNKVVQIYGESASIHGFSKSIAILQVLDDFHLSLENLAVTMYPSIDHAGMQGELRKKRSQFKERQEFNVKEIDGQLGYRSSIIRIEEEKAKEFISGQDTRRVLENQIEDLFTPVPNADIKFENG